MEQANKLTERIIGSCFKVHRGLGPGFNERIYHNALKALFFIPPLFEYQLLSYLKASKLHLGLLINFGNKSCQVKRVML